MTASKPAARSLLHTRRVAFTGYRRDDGLWDIEAQMSDARAYASFGPDKAPIPEGEPIHDMGIRVTLDDGLVIQEIAALMHSVPAPECARASDPLQAMVGVVMGAGWRQTIESRMGGIKGCTHLRELLFNMATAAYQTIPVYQSQMARQGASLDNAPPPRHLGRCMTWDLQGPVVQRFYPRFYLGS